MNLEENLHLNLHDTMVKYGFLAIEKSHGKIFPCNAKELLYQIKSTRDGE